MYHRNVNHDQLEPFSTEYRRMCDLDSCLHRSAPSGSRDCNYIWSNRLNLLHINKLQITLDLVKCNKLFDLWSAYILTWLSFWINRLHIQVPMELWISHALAVIYFIDFSMYQSILCHCHVVVFYFTFINPRERFLRILIFPTGGVEPLQSSVMKQHVSYTTYLDIKKTNCRNNC